MTCRICGAGDLAPILDLGDMPLVNNLLERPDDPCPVWPLRLVFCRSCSLVQLSAAPPPHRMFGHYRYFTGQSRTMVAHFHEWVDRVVEPGQRVLEIASNDGCLLQRAQRRGAIVLGIDPAVNVAEHANRTGIPTLCRFFNEAVAGRIEAGWGPADIVFANNVLAHVPDPNEIAAGIQAVLSRRGRAHIEVPYVARMVTDGTFDTIYHEHHCYFSVTALAELFRRHDLRIVGVEDVPVHGGSLHLEIAREGDESAVQDRIAEERSLGLCSPEFYIDLNERLHGTRVELTRALSRFDRVAGYGAAAKAVVMLNAFGLDARRVPWLADISPHKQGRFVPGTGQAVVPPRRLLEDPPDACVLFAWNLRDEIVEQLQPFMERGGKLIIPFPQVTVL